MTIAKAALAVALVLLLFTDFGLNSLRGQAKGPDPIFKPALEEIQSEVSIPILLPTKLPFVRGIKLARGTVSDDGYFIGLYYSEQTYDAAYAAGFGGSTQILRDGDIGNTRRVALSGGRTGLFRPISCGGSCAPANLWWEQNGAMYTIQIKLASASEKEQKKILVEMANSVVIAGKQ